MTPASGVTAPVTRLVISLRSGQPATVRATWMPTVPSSPSRLAHHAEVDDRAVQLGVLDRPEGLDELVVRDGHASSLWRAPLAGV